LKGFFEGCDGGGRFPLEVHIGFIKFLLGWAKGGRLPLEVHIGFIKFLLGAGRKKKHG